MIPQALQLGLLGSGISHSLSPLLHRAALTRLELAGGYALFEAPDEHTARLVLASLRSGSTSGLNVTTPWKGWARQFADCHLCRDGDGWRAVDGPPPWPVNTLWRREDGQICAASTDGPGLLLALASVAPPIPLAGRRVVVLGAGGAAESVVPSFVQAGASRVVLAARDPAKALTAAASAAAAAESLGQIVSPGRIRPADWQHPAAMADAQLIVHASRLGHGLALAPGAELPAELDAALAHLPWRTWLETGAPLVDLVYAPAGALTPVERWGLERGLVVAVGVGRRMLAAQAALSFELWSGQREDPAAWLGVLESAGTGN